MKINRRIFLTAGAVGSCLLAWRGVRQIVRATDHESLIALRIAALGDSIPAASLASLGAFSGAKASTETLLSELLGVTAEYFPRIAGLSDRELRTHIEKRITGDFCAGSVQMHAGWMIASSEAALFQLLARHRSLS